MIYYFRMAIRALKHDIRPTILLIVSLTVGLVTFMMVSGYVTYEQQYDRVFPDSNNIYRITTDIYSGGELQISKPKCERILGEELKKNYSEVIKTGFLTGSNNPQYKIGEDILKNENVYHASPGILDIFSLELIQGSREDVLTHPYTVLISESTAKKYFGSENPVGKTILKYPAFDYRIEGVFKDVPNQAHFMADMFLSFHDQMHLPPPVKEHWGETVFYTYLKLNPKTNIDDFEGKMNQLVMGNKKEAFAKSNSLHQYHLQPLKNIHLNSQLKDELQVNARADYLYILLVVSLLILFAVGFNYIHFSFTRALNNAANAGLKKVVGANGYSLINQSLLESVLLHIGSLILAIFICIFIVPVVQNQFGITIDFSFNNHIFWMGLTIILMLSIFVNGIIPGVFVNRFSSLQLFQLKSKPASRGFSYKQLFVVGQFVIVMVIIIGIIGINKQLSFLKEKDKGLNFENTIVVKVPQNMRRTSSRINNLDAFEQEILRNPTVRGISQSNSIPGELLAFNFSYSEMGADKSGKAAVLVAGANYLKNFDIKLIAGDDFASQSENTNSGCIINQSCLSDLGYKIPDEAIGKVLKLKDESGMQNMELKITGIISDFNFQNMREVPGPMILFDWTGNMIWGNYFVKLNQPEVASVIPFIHEKFKATFPNYPFEYFVLEDFYNQQFVKESQLLKMLQVFVLIAILISSINFVCDGLVCIIGTD